MQRDMRRLILVDCAAMMGARRAGVGGEHTGEV
jgi:hypothetical protein